jgi:hypothetical protein
MQKIKEPTPSRAPLSLTQKQPMTSIIKAGGPFGV